MSTLSNQFDGPEGRAHLLRKIVEDFGARKNISDLAFDSVFPSEISALSEIHWTPVRVARRAAQLLVSHHQSRILDVGAGCGKFCIVGALSTQGRFVGVEQRPHLVDVARTAAKEFYASRARFMNGNVMRLDWDGFDGIYFFNPFYEQKVPVIRIDEQLVFGERIFEQYVAEVASKLRRLEAGTRVVTYHGFGAPMPSEYRLVLKESATTGFLELWTKRRPALPRAKTLLKIE